MWQALHIVENGGTSGGKSGYGLEEGICKVADAAVNQEGEHPEEREDDPYGCHEQEGITAIQGVFGMPTHH